MASIGFSILGTSCKRSVYVELLIGSEDHFHQSVIFGHGRSSAVLKSWTNINLAGVERCEHLPRPTPGGAIEPLEAIGLSAISG